MNGHGLHKTPPDTNGYTPEQLYSEAELEMVARWIKAHPHGSTDAEKDTHTRAMVTEILESLRKHGYYPDRVGEDGRVIWGVRLKSAVQMLFEKELYEHKLLFSESKNDPRDYLARLQERAAQAETQRSGRISDLESEDAWRGIGQAAV